MFDLSVHWLVTILDASLKAVLLAALAALALRVLRVRDSNLRHRVWTGVLIGMLALPALAQVMPALRMPFAIDLGGLITRWEREQTAAIAAAEAAALPQVENANALSANSEPPAPLDELHAASASVTAVDATLHAPSDSAFGPDGLEFGPPGNGFPSDGRRGPAPDWSTANTAPPVIATEPFPIAEPFADESAATAAVAAAPSVSWLERLAAHWPLGLFLLWASGATVLALRLVLALVSGRWLLSRSSPVDAVEFDDLGLAPQLLQLQGRQIPVLECERLRVPITLGWHRPHILLPLDWIEWPAEKLAAVLTHERTHVERRDCAVMFLAELNRCYAWFHPLAWWLKRHLSALAEAACDDAVIDTIGDRATYARHLLEVASVVSRHHGRVLTTGVSMARRSNVECRIHSILDARRPLTQRLTRATALLLIGVIVPVIALAAALQPAGEGVVDAEVATSAQDAQTDSATDEVTALAINEAPEAQINDAAPASSPTKSAQADDTGPVTVRGVVTDTDLKPIAGARLWFAMDSADGHRIHELGRSQVDGRFELTLPPEAAAALRSAGMFGAKTLLARADGYAADSMPLGAFEVTGLGGSYWAVRPEDVDGAFGDGRFASHSLRLGELAEPVHGKLLSLEGQPLAGVQVLMEDLHDVDMPALDEALKNLSRDQVNQVLMATQFAGRYSTRTALQAVFPAVTTNEQGEFTLPGLGRNQVAVVTLLGERVEAERFYLMGRDHTTVAIPHLSSFPNGAKDHFLGTRFTHVVASGVPVSGVVREFRSGQGIADAVIYVERLFSKSDGNRLDGNLRLFTDHIRTRTDAEGRYRLLGIPPGEAHVLNVIAPTTQPWLIGEQSFDVAPDQSEVPLDLQLVRGVWIEGRLTDADTGEPLRGAVDYMALEGNPHSPKQLGLSEGWQLHRFLVDADGRFRAAGLPGKGVVGALAIGGKDYPRSVGAAEIPGYDSEGGYIAVTPRIMPLSNWNLLRQIEPAADAETFQCDLTLSAGLSIPGRAVGPTGEPIAGLQAIGVVPQSEFWFDQQESRFEVVSYDPAVPRDLFFKSVDNSLVGHARLEGPAPEELVVTLQPSVTVTGRLIARETAEPAVDYLIYCDSTDRGGFRFPEQLRTNSAGRFTIPSLLAGVVYQTHTVNPQHFSSGKNNFTIDLTQAKPGDTVDLGDVRGQDKESMQAAMSKPPTVAASLSSPEDEHDVVFEFAGTVVDEAGQPVSGAQVSLNYWRKSAATLGEPLAVTDREGRFQFSRKQSDFADGGDDSPWRYAHVVVVKEGLGFDAGLGIEFETTGRIEAALPEQNKQWLAEIKKSWTKTLTIPADLPIRGRIVTTEGQPVVGATVEPINIWEGKKGSLDEWLAETKRPQANYYSARNQLLQLVGGNFIDGPQWTVLPPVTTDADGWFTLTGLGRERITDAIIRGPGIESDAIFIRSQPGEIVRVARSEQRRSESDQTTYYPAEFTHVAGPSQPVVGRITDGRTGQPVAGIVVRADQLAHRRTGGALTVEFVVATTDADGRYRLAGLPIGQNSVEIVPPKGSNHLPGGLDVKTSPAQPEATLDVQVTRGVIVHGRAVDGTTGEPLRGRVQAFVFNNNPHLKEAAYHRRGNFDYHYWCDPDGRFAIPVLPGPGILAFNAEDHESYPRAAGEEHIQGPSQMAGMKLFQTLPSYCVPQNHHALAQLDFEPNAGEQTINFSLGAGATLAGRIVDAAGQPVAGCYLFGENGYSSWYPHTAAEFTVQGYFPREGRRLMAFHPGTNTVGEVVLQREPPAGAIEIKLAPAGRIVGRILDADGEPLRDVTFQEAFPQSGPADKHRGQLLTRLEGRQVATDAEGRFELVGLLPGQRYSADAVGPYDPSAGVSLPYGALLGRLFENVSVDGGETRDLGDLRPKPPEANQDEKPSEREASAVKSPPMVVPMPRAAGDAPARPAQAQAAVAASTPDKSAAPEAPYVYAGKVVDPDGQPVAGAAIHVWYFTRAPLPNLQPRAVSDANGEFRFEFDLQSLDPGDSENEAQFPVLIAVKEGFGFAHAAGLYCETSGRLEAHMRKQFTLAIESRVGDLDKIMEQEFGPRSNLLKLTRDDIPIRGRLVDIDGRPVVGARVQAHGVLERRDATQSWDQLLSADDTDTYGLQQKTHRVVEGPRGAVVAPAIVTDDKGRFTLRGIGVDRDARISVTGGTVEATDFSARTAAGETIRVPRSRSNPEYGDRIHYPAEFSLALGPSQPLVGVIRDETTQAPIPNCVLDAQVVGSRVIGGETDFIRAVTDAEGRYRLEGLPPGRCSIRIRAPRTSHYLDGEFDLTIGKEPTPLTHDERLFPGVRITGRVLVERSGEPVNANVEYHTLPKNPHLARAKSFLNTGLEQWGNMTDSEGRFAINVLPGPGVLRVVAANHPDYAKGIGADGIPADAYEVDSPNGTNAMRTSMLGLQPQYANLVKYIDIDPAAPPETVELQLVQGKSFTVKFRSPEGKPPQHLMVHGEHNHSSWHGIEGETLFVVGYFPAEGRRVIAYDPERNQVAYRDLQGEQPEVQMVDLGPAGIIRGRILDAQGDPLDNGTLSDASQSFASPLAAASKFDPQRGPIVRTFGSGEITTDAEGRFEIRGVVPGLKYSVQVSGLRQFNGRDQQFLLGTVFEDVTVEPGETKDLGDLRLHAPNDSAQPTAAVDAEPQPQAAQPATPAKADPAVRGTLTSDNGAPLAGVPVAVVGWRLGELVRGLYDPQLEVVAEAQSAADGSYTLPLSGLTNTSHRGLCVIARTEGRGLAWKEFVLGPGVTQIDLVLQPEQPLRLRLIDIDGQPADGVLVTIGAVAKTGSKTGEWNGVGGGRQLGTTIWPQSVTTDAEGRCVLHGVAADCGVSLSIAGSDRFAPQDISLNTGQSEVRLERDRTYRPQIRNVTAGEEAVLALAPAQTFAGLVTYADSKAPAPLARVSIWASQQEEYGSWSAVNGTTDANGRYRISPQSGVRFRATAYAPVGTPYLARELEAVAWKPETVPNLLDVALPRGVLIRGSIVEAGTGRPVPRASVQYHPKNNNPFDADGIITGWQAIVDAAEDGSFEIAVLPGRGTLIVHGGNDEYVLREMPSRQVSQDQPGGQRYYAHAFVPLDLPEAGETQNLTIELEPGRKVAGRLVDEAGAPIERALMLTRLKISPAHLTWEGFEREVLGGEFELASLPAGEAVPCSFLDPVRMLGATVLLSGDDPTPTITLRPCGSARLRMVDSEAKPFAGGGVNLQMVVTPGCPLYSDRARVGGEVAADEDFIGNLDRTNHWDRVPSGEDGVIELPALIPGATYRLYRSGKGVDDFVDFTVEPGKTHDLGDVVVRETE